MKILTLTLQKKDNRQLRSFEVKKKAIKVKEVKFGIVSISQNDTLKQSFLKTKFKGQ